jgi:Family of unknown function (DUF6084)
MIDLRFAVEDVFAEPYAAVPQLTARLRIAETSGEKVHAMALRCQVRIEPQRRRYAPDEEEALLGLFGPRERWNDTLRPLLWMQCNTTVPGFAGNLVTDLALPCTYDFEVVGSRYLHALREGTVPLLLLFSGTVFTKGETGFAVHQVPWDCEARFELPVTVWRDMIRAYYPSKGWLQLDEDVLKKLADYRARHGLISWEETVESLLAGES